MNMENIISDIIHRTDGPVTQFVAISRAMELAANKTYPAEDIANALNECLGTVDFPLQSNEY